MSLYVASVLYGAVVAVMFGWLVDWPAVRITVNRMVAYALEFALYADEPGLVFRAQARLLGQNARLLRQMAGPCVVAALLFAAVYAALAPADATVAITRTAQAPPGIAVDAVGIRIARTGETAWRLRDGVHGDSQSSWILRFTVFSSAAASVVALALWQSGRRSGVPTP